MDSWYPRDHGIAENLSGLETNLMLNNVYTMLAKVTIKLIFIFLSNFFFDFFTKMKNKKQTVFVFHFFMKMKKGMTALQIQSTNLSNMKIVVNYLNFGFHILK